MKLTARQRKFLILASREEGYDPIEPPSRAPVLKSHEILPLIDDKLIAFDEIHFIWDITPAGRASLDQDRGGNG